MKQHNKYLLVLLALGVLLSCARAPRQLVSEKPATPIVDLASEKIRDSIVMIESENGSGTGFFVAPNKVVTNTHVVAHAGSVSVKSPDEEKDWTIEGVVGFDVKNGLVILKLTGEGKPLPLDDRFQIGEPVSIPGYRDGEFKVVEGKIQSIVKNNKWLRIKATKETDGSPVLNNNGQVIGVIVPYGSYAVPSSALATLLDKAMPMEPLSAWQQREQVRATAYYSFGKEKFSVKNYAGALVDFDKAIELNPEYVRAYYERGRAQAYLGDYDSAIASLTQVIKMDSEDADVYYVRGNVKAHLDEYADAIVDLDKAIALDDHHANAYSNRGGVKYGLGESESARGNAEKAQSLYEAAIADCDKAIQIDPEYAYAYNSRGAAQASLGDFEGAILDFNRAIEIEPENVDFYGNRGAVKLAFGELESARGNPEKMEGLYESAIEDFTQVIKVNPEEDSAYNDRGLIKFKLGESEVARGNAKEAQRLYESAIEDYTQSLQIDPDELTYNNRGFAKTAFGELESTRGNVEKTEALYEAAIADYIQAIKINPKYAKAYKNQAKVKCKLGDIESTRGNVGKARKLYHDGITDYDEYIQLNNPEDVNESAADLASEKVKDSTVRVMSWVGDFYNGSGFFVKEDKVVTNVHVVAQPGPIFVKLRGKEEICAVEEVAAFDAENDLVILKIRGKGIPLSVGDNEAIQSGEPVVVVGYPDEKYKVIKGTIRSASNSGAWLRMTPYIGSGSSGSPVLNRSGGQVVGINAARDERYGYAIPSSILKALLVQSEATEPLAKWQKRELIRAYALFVQGQMKYNANHYHEAVTDFNKAIEINAQFFYAYYKRGDAQFALGNYEAAITDYDKAEKINDRIFNVYFDLGLAKFKLGDNEAAIVDYDKAIATDPEHATAYSNRGVAKFSLGDLEGAILDYNKAIQINPEHANAYSNRGGAKFRLGESETANGNIKKARHLYQAAVSDATQAIQINPEHAGAYNNRGKAKEALGQHEAAKADFDKAKELDPDIGQ